MVHRSILSISPASLLAALFASLLTLVSAPAQSASLTQLFHFDLHYTAAGVVEGPPGYTGYLYGSTYDTSQTSGGTLFRTPKDGSSGPVTLRQLSSDNGDGYSPRATLLASQDGFLYGTTHNSARTSNKLVAGRGTIFRIAPDGSGYTTIHDFGGVTGNPSVDDSIIPDFPLIEDGSGSYLYGVTAGGGNNGTGTIYRLRKSDRLLEVLHHFAAVNTDGTSVNGEGYAPSAPLLLASDGRLYGVTQYGGTNLVGSSSTLTYGAGTIFSINPDGSGFRSEFSFPSLDTSATVVTNLEGASPASSLVEVSRGVFIGAATTGGTPSDTTMSGQGTIYKLDTSSGSATVSKLYDFDQINGSTPIGRLAFSNTTGLVYGIATSGSATATPITSLGTIYSFNPATSQYAIVYAMTVNDSFSIAGGITLGSEGDLYGATQSGGACTQNYPYTGFGTVFRYSLTSNGSFSSYSNCTPAPTSDSGGGRMDLSFLAVLSLLLAVWQWRRVSH